MLEQHTNIKLWTHQPLAEGHRGVAIALIDVEDEVVEWQGPAEALPKDVLAQKVKPKGPE